MTHWFIGNSRSGDIINFLDSELGHIKAKRIKQDELIGVVMNNTKFICKLLSTSPLTALIQAESNAKHVTTRLAIASPLPKSKRKNILIEKLTEIGVFEYIPIKSKRTTFIPDSNTISRLNKISESALKQSGSNKIKISQVLELDGLIDYARTYELCLVLHPHSNSKLLDTLTNSKSILCVLGPEGGFTSEELTCLVNNNFKSVSLNSNILRIETCAIYLSSVINEYASTHAQ